MTDSMASASRPITNCALLKDLSAVQLTVAGLVSMAAHGGLVAWCLIAGDTSEVRVIPPPRGAVSLQLDRVTSQKARPRPDFEPLPKPVSAVSQVPLIDPAALPERAILPAVVRLDADAVHWSAPQAKPVERQPPPTPEREFLPVEHCQAELLQKQPREKVEPLEELVALAEVPTELAIQSTASTGAEVDVPPQLIYNPHPEYPQRAQSEGRAGSPRLLLLIRANGQVGEVRIVRSSGHRDLDASAVRQLATWRFVPATRAGTKVDAWRSIDIHFTLD